MKTEAQRLNYVKREAESIMRMFDNMPLVWRDFANNCSGEPNAIVRAYVKGWTMAKAQKHLKWQRDHRYAG